MENLKALVVDSNKASRKNLLTVIKHGVGVKDVKVVESVQIGVNYLKQDAVIEVIFLDFETVGNDLFKFILAAKKLVNNADLKFILLSNNASKEFLMEAASKGISAFILKPYIYNTIVSKVKKVCSSKLSRQDKRLSLLEAISVEIYTEDHKICGAMIDISSGGCLIKAEPLGQYGIDIYDNVSLKIPMKDEFAELQGQVIRMERDTSSEENKISAALIFNDMNEKTAMQFAKLWAYLLSLGTK